MIHNRYKHADLWFPPLANLVMAMVVQHACQLFSEFVFEGVWLQFDALFLVFPLLYLRYGYGLFQAAFIALAYDAMWPGPYGSRLVIYCIMLLLFYPLRTRLRRENHMNVFWLAAGMNLLIFFALMLVAYVSSGNVGRVSFDRWGMDLLVSELFVGLFAFAWIEAQRMLIARLSGVDPADYKILD